MAQTLPTSLSLLDGLREQSPVAWQRFVHLYAPLVYQWGRKAGLQPEDVADVTQDVFRTVHAKFDRFDRNHKVNGAFRSWLYGITRISILDHCRQRAKQDVGVGGTDAHLALQEHPEQIILGEEPPETEQVLGFDRIVLEQAVNLIRNDHTDSTWQAFWQTAVAGRKSSEVAKDLGLSSAAVRQAKSRVMRRLRDELEGLA